MTIVNGPCKRENCPSDAHEVKALSLLGVVASFRLTCKVCASTQFPSTLRGYTVWMGDDDE